MKILPDYYAVLQVNTNASKEIIETAYKRLARSYHPDKNPGHEATAKERMIRINEAYQVLSDAKRKTLYDHKRRKEVWRVFYSDGLIGLYRHLNR